MLAPPVERQLASPRNLRLLALFVPSALLAGALGSQYIGGLFPCDMCYWQRWPHAAAILLALASFTAPANAPRSRLLVGLAAAAIAVSGAIGVYHVGVEMGFYEGVTACSAGSSTTDPGALLDEIMNAPVIRCDQVQWEFLSVSMAGWNAIISLGTAALIAIGLVKGKKA
ncbi:disulfide bond formation protein B [Sphingomicrobium lutaoense]|uniref:Disulfide bond formation protein DsbB n=1 Tax=Sphingomicrobium lutaoense TaxID=515949 RepID=A0A839Z4C4_9SPHN|nr:disulfide bond formation protein B [Sphingomicrobium lutaoense]MBB3764465.1 disulfide bond formation protein DsbB [Sphingomicrobium lutaoense]